MGFKQGAGREPLKEGSSLAANAWCAQKAYNLSAEPDALRHTKMERRHDRASDIRSVDADTNFTFPETGCARYDT